MHSTYVTKGLPSYAFAYSLYTSDYKGERGTSTDGPMIDPGVTESVGAPAINRESRDEPANFLHRGR